MVVHVVNIAVNKDGGLKVAEKWTGIEKGAEVTGATSTTY